MIDLAEARPFRLLRTGTMHDFDYQSPRTLAEAVALLAQGDSKPLAGGTDLIDHMRTGRYRPAVVVDLKKIPELTHLVVDASGLRLGAAVPCYKIQSTCGIKSSYSALADAVAIIGGVQIQNRATVGGNLCTSGPAADSAPALLALGQPASSPDRRAIAPLRWSSSSRVQARTSCKRVKSWSRSRAAPLRRRAARTIGGSSLATRWTSPSSESASA